MAISAMVIIARVLHDLDLVKSDLGLVTLCGYAVNDVLAWVIFSLVIATATQGTVTLGSVGLLLVFTLVFTALSLTLGLRLVDRAIAYIGSHRPDNPGAVLSFVCCLGLLWGAVTQWAGLTALFGFFLAGLMAGEAQTLSERTRHALSQMVHSIFVPLYFASIGLYIDFLANFDLLLIVFVTLVSIVGKYLGAWLGALGPGIAREDRVSIAIAFTPSGVTGIVVAGVALELEILDAVSGRRLVAVADSRGEGAGRGDSADAGTDVRAAFDEWARRARDRLSTFRDFDAASAGGAAKP